MKIGKMLLGLALALASTAALASTPACTIDAPGISESARADLKASCLATFAKENPSAAAVAEAEQKIAKISAWGQVAKDAAGAIGIAAHELNVGVNEFLASPAGKLTAFLIVWKVAGSAILSKLLGLLMLPFAWYLVKRIANGLMVKEITYETKPVLWGLFNRRYVASVRRDDWDNMGDGKNLILFLLVAVATIFTGIVVFGVIL